MPPLEDRVCSLILRCFPHVSTDGQKEVCALMAHFLYDTDLRSAFLLKGYAGTGKTSLVSALIQILPQLHVSTVLLAPTGRAAKVLSSYSSKTAYTIHKKIYHTGRDSTGMIRTVRALNKHAYTLFIVDEASMIGQESDATGKSLLDDLVDYVYSGNHCRLMLIGDTAQLPPVGQSESAALNGQYLTSILGLSIMEYELTEVVRQQSMSGILFNATILRKHIASIFPYQEAQMPLFNINSFPDVVNLSGENLMETLFAAYEQHPMEGVCVVCRSNKRANLFNQGIRNSILFREGEIAAGDYIMVVKNNYYWSDEKSGLSFIANGDIVEVMSIRNQQELYGFRFADASLRFVDYPDTPQLDCKLLLNTLYSDSPALSSEETEQLFQAVMEDYADIPSKARRMQELRNNPYFNALQVKFSYALTCHKTQGGQWNTVIIDKGYLGDNPIDRDYLRWLYTAFTRATDKVYLLGYEDDFFSQA